MGDRRPSFDESRPSVVAYDDVQVPIRGVRDGGYGKGIEPLLAGAKLRNVPGIVGIGVGKRLFASNAGRDQGHGALLEGGAGESRHIDPDGTMCKEGLYQGAFPTDIGQDKTPLPFADAGVRQNAFEQLVAHDERRGRSHEDKQFRSARKIFFDGFEKIPITALVKCFDQRLRKLKHGCGALSLLCDILLSPHQTGLRELVPAAHAASRENRRLRRHEKMMKGLTGDFGKVVPGYLPGHIEGNPSLETRDQLAQRAIEAMDHIEMDAALEQERHT